MKSMREHTEIYIEVVGIDAIWEHVKTFKSRHRIRDLFDREHRMTGFHIAEPMRDLCGRAWAESSLTTRT